VSDSARGALRRNNPNIALLIRMSERDGPYCAPVYAIGLGLLLLFARPFGLVVLPFFFDPDSYAPPLEDPWDYVRSMAAHEARARPGAQLAAPKVPPLDIPTLQALALWAAVLIVALGLLADLAIVRLDPRIRSSGNTVG
jgi:hypothetical protein